MCGRYACAITTLGRWGSVFKVLLEELDGRYNIAPSAMVPVFRKEGWCTMRWGLVPSWSKENKTKYATFNARMETFRTKPAFRSAWSGSRRCLIPLSGYYEWKIVDGRKRPFYVTSTRDEPLVIAGLWEEWRNEEESLLSCTIITAPAVGSLQQLHHRMPIFIEPVQAHDWLNGDKTQAMKVLSDPSLQYIRFYEVSSEVGNTRNRGRGLIEPVHGGSEE